MSENKHHRIASSFHICPKKNGEENTNFLQNSPELLKWVSPFTFTSNQLISWLPITELPRRLTQFGNDQTELSKTPTFERKEAAAQHVYHPPLEQLRAPTRFWLIRQNISKTPCQSFSVSGDGCGTGRWSPALHAGRTRDGSMATLPAAPADRVSWAAPGAQARAGEWPRCVSSQGSR